MRVFKFGGASVQNAEKVKNFTEIVRSQPTQDMVIIVSAMGKMTNAFEKLIQSYTLKSADFENDFAYIVSFHREIMADLFVATHPAFLELDFLMGQVGSFFESNTSDDYNFIYDQVVGYGELISTKIIHHYLIQQGITNQWLDARKLIVTDKTYRTAIVDWHQTQENILAVVQAPKIYLTQGFIGGSGSVVSTTLGREGSDYTAAIFAYILHAENMTIWKDVPGVLNADPRYFEQTTLLDKISYREALEMAFYGATVIHPKTIKPLENRNIPMYVRSFLNPENPGTKISKGVEIFPSVSCFTYKEHQILLSIATKDFSFMMEHHISHVFQLFTDYQIKVNLIQNSAISFSVCIEDLYGNFDKMYADFDVHYEVEVVKDAKLISIRHYKNEELDTYLNSGKLLLIQQTSDVAQLILK